MEPSPDFPQPLARKGVNEPGVEGDGGARAATRGTAAPFLLCPGPAGPSVPAPRSAGPELGGGPGQQPSEGAAAGREATLTQENAELRIFPHLEFKESVCLLFSVFVLVH